MEDTAYYSAVKCYGGAGYTDSNFTAPIHGGAGVYYAVLPNSSGCDSIICLTPAESPPYSLCMISVDENYHNEIVRKQEEAYTHTAIMLSPQIPAAQCRAAVQRTKPCTLP